MRRRLFWKVYLTMLAGLVLVGVLLGVAWRVTGDRPWVKWQELRGRLAEIALPLDTPPGAVEGRLDAVGEEFDADISLYAPDGRLVAATGEPVVLRPPRDRPRGPRHGMRIELTDGRILLARLRPPPPEPVPRILMFVLLVAGGVGIAAYPVARRLTRRLEDLRSGVESWGSGDLAARVSERGSDEIADVARSFNAAATKVEAVVEGQKALLANASHELRSPLARLRMAVEMAGDAPNQAQRDEIARSLGEIDTLVEEILLASRLDHDTGGPPRRVPVDLLGLAAEEAARCDASLSGEPVEIDGDPTLLRRLIRNLLENAGKHGAPPVEITVAAKDGKAVLKVADRGTGIPPEERERVFEPFYRPAGRAESAGGWGLGLTLVRQIARRHGGQVACRERDGGGTLFVVELPGAAAS